MAGTEWLGRRPTPFPSFIYDLFLLKILTDFDLEQDQSGLGGVVIHGALPFLAQKANSSMVVVNAFTNRSTSDGLFYFASIVPE